MVEIDYYRAKAKILEFQMLQMQLNQRLSEITDEKNKYLVSIGLDPKKNYTFNDEEFGFQHEDKSNETGGSGDNKGNS